MFTKEKNVDTRPEKELTRWELMKRNRKSKTQLFAEAMMKRQGKTTGRWNYATGKMYDPDVVVRSHETLVEYNPAGANKEFWREAETIMCVNKYRDDCMELEGLYDDFWACTAAA